MIRTHRSGRGARALAVAVLLAAAAAVPPTAFGQGSASPSKSPSPEEPSARQDAAIEWLPYAPGAFRRAQHENRLIMLVIDAPWSQTSHRAEQTLWSDSRVAAAIDARFVPVRVRADLRPDLVHRHPTSGLPAISLLLPDGAPLYFVREGREPRRVTLSTTDPERLIEALGRADAYYRDGKQEVIDRSRQSLEDELDQSRPERGKVDPSVATAVATQLEGEYDAKRRYFGGAPRVPRLEDLELLGVLSVSKAERWGALFRDPLTTMVDNLSDSEDGGLYSLARGLDWEDPVRTKLLSINARALELLSRVPASGGEAEQAEARAARVAGFLIERLGLESGGFAEAASTACPGGLCETPISAHTAAAAAALLEAGRVFDREAWIERGLAAARFLDEQRYRQRRGVVRATVDGRAVPGGTLLLTDLSWTCWAFLAAHEASGERRWLSAAEDLAATALNNLADRDGGMLADRLVVPAGPVTLRSAHYPVAGNARMARCLTRLSRALPEAQETVYRRAADRLLAAFAGSDEEMSAAERAVYAAAVLELDRIKEKKL